MQRIPSEYTNKWVKAAGWAYRLVWRSVRRMLGVRREEVAVSGRHGGRESAPPWAAGVTTATGTLTTEKVTNYTWSTHKYTTMFYIIVSHLG